MQFVIIRVIAKFKAAKVHLTINCRKQQLQ